jgi:hypothetical protein
METQGDLKDDFDLRLHYCRTIQARGPRTQKEVDTDDKEKESDAHSADEKPSECGPEGRSDIYNGRGTHVDLIKSG